MRSKIILATSLLLAALLLAAGCTGTAETPKAAEGDNVTVEYTGSFLNGTVFDTSIGGTPFTFTLGNDEVIPGFENAVIGLAVNESVNVTIPAAEAYGEYNSTLVISMPLENLPNTTAVGSRFMLPNIDRNHIYRVVAMNETAITLDGNPVLAGQDLRFSIKLLSLKKAGA